MTKILFVGNSFTYYNSMPEKIFAPIVGEWGYDAAVTSVTKGGWSLSRFADPSDEYGKKLAELLSSERFDAVILQEQSHTPISDRAAFFSAVRELYGRISATGAKVYLYATWGYKAEHPRLSLYGSSTADMESKLREAYSAIGGELGIPVLHVGAAMLYAYLKGARRLYMPDNYHPDVGGSLVAAMTIAAGIFGNDPRHTEYIPEGVTAEDMLLYKEAAAIRGFRV